MPVYMPVCVNVPNMYLHLFKLISERKGSFILPVAMGISECVCVCVHA
jgi:hypothetical protein